MKKKLSIFLFAIVAGIGSMFAKTVKINGLFYGLDADTRTATVWGPTYIPSVAEVPFVDWESLPVENVVESFCPANTYYPGLKSVKVYADALFIHVLVEPNMDKITDLSLVPLHIFMNTDNSDETGGNMGIFTDANINVLIEGMLYLDGEPCEYTPGVFKWAGEVGAGGWEWDEVDISGIVAKSQLRADGKIDIMVNRTLIPVKWDENEFGIGFDIQQQWESVGILPQDITVGSTPILKVKIDKNNIPVEPESVDTTEIIISDHVSIPESVEYKEVTYSVIGIEADAFKPCADLVSVTLPNSIAYIEDNAFIADSIKEIQYSGTQAEWISKEWRPKQVSKNYALYIGDQLLSIAIIPDDITGIGAYVFENCNSIHSVTLGSNVTEISWSAFSNCTINEIRFTGTMEEWLNKSWYILSENYALYINGKLQSTVTIPDGVISIAEGAFANCNSVKHVVFSSSVKVIGCEAFYGCQNIKTITCYSQRPPSVCGEGPYYYSFSPDMPYSTIIYVPDEYMQTYILHDFWGLFDVRSISEMGVESVQGEKKHSIKTIRNGNIYILTGDKTYTVQGQEVR